MSYDYLLGKGRLTVNLNGVKENYERLSRLSVTSECAPVLKADAYGLGLEPVARTLSEAGASTFFVALPEEGIQLRKILPSARIFILHGFMSGEAEGMARKNLVPVINSVAQAYEWLTFCKITSKYCPAALQIDTGMSRFGLSEDDLKHDWLRELPLCLVMSHLACADTPEHPANKEQLACFERLTGYFPSVPRSLSASSGIFLGKEFHFDLVRPGAALYGIAPQKDMVNPLAQVVSLEVPVWQVRDVRQGDSVGYGYCWQAPHDMRIATVGIGYADGFFRSLSGRGTLWFKGTELPVLGRVSMDSVSVDVSNPDSGTLKPGDYVTVLGSAQSVDDLAQKAGTIGYEVLTALGRRYSRYYQNG
ncbi:alanine racemase [Acetobacteraceae bacterium ESL0709]|nr:alanine racemase [Acetobacteraceae bacterium ESL0697]MDF7678181.1 alanine racemase [Acetobacteraceae bacterium ESL0709]